MEIISGIFIVIPSLLILIAYSIKGFFIDENYNPYDKLTNINSFNSLRNGNGKGFKRFLAAIKYEHLRKRLLFIVDGRTLLLAFALYFIAILYIINIIKISDTIGFSNLDILYVLTAILPTILTVILPIIVAIILVKISIQIKRLKKQIRG